VYPVLETINGIPLSSFTLQIVNLNHCNSEIEGCVGGVKI